MKNGNTVPFYDYFFIFGKVIYIQLLALISTKALKREPLSKAEQKIIDYLLNGNLASLLDAKKRKISPDNIAQISAILQPFELPLTLQNGRAIMKRGLLFLLMFSKTLNM